MILPKKLIVAVHLAATVSFTSVFAGDYLVTDLGDVTALGLNNQGMVVGSTPNGVGFRFDGTNVVILPRPLQSNSNEPYGAAAINDNGVVGGYGFGGVHVAPAIWGNPGSLIASVGAITAINQDTALIQAPDGDAGPSNGGQLYQFLSDKYSFLSFYPQAINASNVVAGTLWREPENPFAGWATPLQGMRAEGTNVTQILLSIPGFPFAGTVQGTGINRSGVIVGIGYEWGIGSARQGYVWRSPTNAAFIDTLGGASSSAAGINDAGQIAGAVVDASNVSRAIVASAASTPVAGVIPATDLNTQISPGSGWVLHSAAAINNHGQIIGQGTYQGLPRAFLLTPNPESPNFPPSFALDPVGANLALGQTLVLSAQVYGSLPFAFQWQRNGTNVPGATNIVLTLDNAQLTDSGTYSLIASNSAGHSTSASAIVNVDPMPLLAMHSPGTLDVSGLSGQVFQIQSKNSLADFAWTPLGSVTLTNTFQQWNDAGSAALSARFYRAVVQH